MSTTFATIAISAIMLVVIMLYVFPCLFRGIFALFSRIFRAFFAHFSRIFSCRQAGKNVSKNARKIRAICFRPQKLFSRFFRVFFALFSRIFFGAKQLALEHFSRIFSGAQILPSSIFFLPPRPSSFFRAFFALFSRIFLGPNLALEHFSRIFFFGHKFSPRAILIHFREP